MAARVNLPNGLVIERLNRKLPRSPRKPLGMKPIVAAKSRWLVPPRSPEDLAMYRMLRQIQAKGIMQMRQMFDLDETDAEYKVRQDNQALDAKLTRKSIPTPQQAATMAELVWIMAGSPRPPQKGEYSDEDLKRIEAQRQGLPWPPPTKADKKKEKAAVKAVEKAAEAAIYRAAKDGILEHLAKAEQPSPYVIRREPGDRHPHARYSTQGPEIKIELNPTIEMTMPQEEETMIVKRDDDSGLISKIVKRFGHKPKPSKVKP